MARVHFVKSARKDNPVAKKGESYYWWKPMIGGRGASKRYSKERPSRSQLTNSEFLSQLYGIEDEQITKATEPQDLRDAAEALRELGQEEQGKFDNMPDGLQQGDTGQMIEERAQNCESWADELDTIADAWDSELEALKALQEEWDAYDTACSEREEQDEADQDDNEPEEPSEERPGPDAETELASEKVSEAEGASPF
jgi:hypothetical protein